LSVVLLIIGILLFIGLVVFHEFGHFLAARRNGVDVEEFGIGFPPRAWSRQTKKGFLFSLNWLPIGGFVKLKGETDSATGKGTFGAASFSTKAKIMLAGVGMNLLAAFVIFTALAWIGMPQIVENQYSVKSDTKLIGGQVYIAKVESGSPAQKAGLRAGDQIQSINGESVNSGIALPDITKREAGKQVQVAYLRHGQPGTVQVRLRNAAEAAIKGGLGVSTTAKSLALTRATWSAPVQAVGLMGQFTGLTFKGLGTAVAALFRGDAHTASNQVSGPVGIVVVLHDGSTLGYQFILFIIGLISLSLAIMNVLPIPALDGGRFYVILLSRVFKKKLTQEMEERIVGTSFAFLLLLIVLITIVDVKRFF
jgi:regulator of sigma E protease